MPPVLNLVVPAFASRLRAATVMPRLPVLEKCFARGAVEDIGRTSPSPDSWRLEVLAMLGLPADRLHASAPLEWLGQGGEPRQGSWLDAEFVHLEMGSRSARLHRIDAFDPASGTALMKSLAAHLKDAGFTALAAAGPAPHFFLHNARTLEAICPAPDFDMGADVQQLLPKGKNGAELRRLLTEVQMLLHEHPVNTQRERAGLRAVNAIWIWGLGAFESFQPLPPLRIWSDEPYLRGLCRLHQTKCLPLPRTAVELVKGGEPGVVVIPMNEVADPAAALQALETDWFAPLAAAVSAGTVSRVELYLDRWQVSIDRAALRRFWRRGRSLSVLLQ